MKGNPVPVARPKNIGIWIRVSTEDQAQGDSPKYHEERARHYAKAQGWTVLEVYNLAGVSGKGVKEHVEAKRMLADVKRGHITALIFSKLARLTRNARELMDFSDFFRQHNADLISLQESIDTATPSGRLFFNMVAVMAQWEREEIADRVKASVSVRARLGMPLSGASPYGYQWKEKKLVVNPDEAPVRKLAYELFLQHRRKGVVARILNESGYRTRSKSKWSDMAVGRTLRCPSAKGVYFINRTRRTGNWSWEQKPESEWGTLRLAPIVSEELWEQCNQILEEHEKTHKRPGKRPVHLFAGLAVCACGQRMYVKANSPKYVCEKCRNKIPVIDLEAIFHDEIRAYFAAPERIAGHLANIDGNLRKKTELLAVHRCEIDKIRSEMARTYRLFLDGGITSKGFGEFYKPAEERLEQLLAELPKLEAEVDHLKITNLSAEEVVTEAEKLHARWPALPMEHKRRIVESIVEKVTIGKGEIELSLSYFPSSEELVQSQQALSGR